MKSLVRDVIELLKDGKWHTVAEIHRETRLQEVKIGILAEFLAAYSFLQLDREERRAKISKVFAEFLEESDKLECHTDINDSRLR